MNVIKIKKVKENWDDESEYEDEPELVEDKSIDIDNTPVITQEEENNCYDDWNGDEGLVAKPIEKYYDEDEYNDEGYEVQGYEVEEDDYGYDEECEQMDKKMGNHFRL